MEIYDVIDAINRVILEQSDGQCKYVLHRSLEVQDIKLYKKFVYKLYLIDKGVKKIVLTHQHMDKVPTNYIDKLWIQEDKAFLIQLLRWFKYGDESILDSNN